MSTKSTHACVAPPLGAIHHVGLVVADRDRAVKLFGGDLGFGRAYEVEGPVTAELAHGIVTAQIKLAFLWMGNALLEIIQPVDELSVHAAYLKEHGEGLHHLAYMVGSVDEELLRIGGGSRPPILANGTLAENPLKWAYIHGQETHGAVIELIERNAAAEAFFAAIYAAVGQRLA